MASILDSLPGVNMPISEISRQLRDMWKGNEHPQSAAPSEFRASQLNLIVQLGWNSTPEEVESIFNTAIEFTQRHPGRIILMAPSNEESDQEDITLKGKLFTQCYIGESHREMCCCEAILLEYASDDPRALFNQVSTWLESDLPVYHWFHRIPVKMIQNKYLAFVKNAKRIIYDSAIESDDFTDIPTPDEWRIRDLADARLLPIKQSIGQVLSTFEPAKIIDQLSAVEIRANTDNIACAGQLKNWIHLCLKNTDGYQALPAKPSLKLTASESNSDALVVEFNYENEQSFNWRLCQSGNEAISTSSLGTCSGEHKATFRQLEAEAILAEAVFFGH